MRLKTWDGNIWLDLLQLVNLTAPPSNLSYYQYCWVTCRLFRSKPSTSEIITPWRGGEIESLGWLSDLPNLTVSLHEESQQTPAFVSLECPAAPHFFYLHLQLICNLKKSVRKCFHQPAHICTQEKLKSRLVFAVASRFGPASSQPGITGGMMLLPGEWQLEARPAFIIDGWGFWSWHLWSVTSEASGLALFICVAGFVRPSNVFLRGAFVRGALGRSEPLSMKSTARAQVKDCIFWWVTRAWFN